MTRYKLTAQAADDLAEIWDYVADDSPKAANRVEAEILAACDTIAEMPLTGRIRRDLTARPVRFWLVQPYRTYWIGYDCNTPLISIVRILQASRDISSIS